jgi:hypothetical protein
MRESVNSYIYVYIYNISRKGKIFIIMNNFTHLHNVNSQEINGTPTYEIGASDCCVACRMDKKKHTYIALGLQRKSRSIRHYCFVA